MAGGRQHAKKAVKQARNQARRRLAPSVAAVVGRHRRREWPALPIEVSPEDDMFIGRHALRYSTRGKTRCVWSKQHLLRLTFRIQRHSWTFRVAMGVYFAGFGPHGQTP